jgi:hypothetical protein
MLSIALRGLAAPPLELLADTATYVATPPPASTTAAADIPISFPRRLGGLGGARGAGYSPRGYHCCACP